MRRIETYEVRMMRSQDISKFTTSCFPVRTLCMVLSGLVIAACALCALNVSASGAEAGDAESALHSQIDGLIAEQAVGPLAGPAADEDFIRRVTLDLHGLLPAPDAVRQFLADEDPHKRAQLVDHLLDSPRYARNLGQVFDVMLMERRRASQVEADKWLDFLVQAFRDNRPANEVFAELIRVDGVDPQRRAPARFLLDREAEPNLLTRDIGRLVFGRDLQCAQCHNHPWIDDYRQTEYYGLYAFVNRSYVFDDKELKKKVLAEKAEGDVTFSSVFTGESGETRPRVPRGVMLAEPDLAEDERYKVKPAKNVRPVPRYSRRERLAELIADGNRQFARNLVNRLWAHMMGRGIVHPLDLDHSDNPPVAPEVLRLLTDEFVAHGFDMRWLLRELALTETYQRSIELPADERIVAAAAVAEEQLAALERQAVELDARVSTLLEVLEQHREQFRTRRTRLAELTTETAAAESAWRDVQKQVEQLLADRRQTRAKAGSVSQAAQLVAQAETDAAAALEHLADDTALQQVRAQLTAHAKRLEQTAAQSQEKLQGLEAQLAKLEPQAAEKQAAFEQIASQHEAAREQVRQSDVAVTDVTRQSVEACALETRLEQRQESVRRLMEFRDAHQAAHRARDEFASARESLKPEVEKRTLAEQAVASAETAVAAERERRDLARTEVEERAAAVQQTQDAANAVQTARAQIADFRERRRDLVAAQAGADQAAEGGALDADALETVPNQLAAVQEFHAARLARLQTSLVESRKRLESRQESLSAAEAALAKRRAEFEARQSQCAALQQHVDRTRDAMVQQQAVLDSLRADVAADMTRSFQLAGLKPLTPEQFAWSVMSVLGIVDGHRKAALAELRKQAAEANKDTEVSAEALEQAVFEKLKGHEQDFVRLYGAGDGQPQDGFFATADQALYLANGSKLLQWLAPQGENLTARLLKQDDPAALANELYLTVLSRSPEPAETQDVTRYLAERPEDRRLAVQELVWGLLTSTEFRFGH